MINQFMARDKGAQILLRSGAFCQVYYSIITTGMGIQRHIQIQRATRQYHWAWSGLSTTAMGKPTHSSRTMKTSIQIETLLHKTRTNMDAWSNLLTASGGALEMSKCSSHVLQWKFSMQGAPVLVSGTTEEQALLTVPDTNSSGVPQAITVLSPYTAHKTPGHYKEPAGIQITQGKRLRELREANTKFLWTCPLSRQEAWTYYFACFLPSVCYPLPPCSSLTKANLELIQQKSLAIIIARCGFNWNTKREMIYGPRKLGGANFRHLYHQQGLGQIKLFLTLWQDKTQARKLLRIALRWFQHAVGTSVSILDDVHTPLPQLISKWIKSFREFLASIKASIHLNEPGAPE
ncbi:hypothetical protein MHU86_25711 [Fragilaria crotonensis]|nr:hypothetical protein MHU86_25711 [Fragilaria crotonensis]